MTIGGHTKRPQAEAGGGGPAMSPRGGAGLGLLRLQEPTGLRAAQRAIIKGG